MKRTNMQPLIHYSYPNQIKLVLNMSELPGTGYAMIYSRLIKINKGITNQYRFTIQNQDQKPVNLLNMTLKFELYDRETGITVISKYIRNGTGQGQCSLTLVDSDTINLDVKYYSYNLYQVDENLNRLPLYTGFNYETSGYVEVVDSDFGYLTESVVLDSFTPVVGTTNLNTGFTSTYGSIIADANPLSNENIALHSIAVYCTNYTGTFEVIGSMANDIEPTIDSFFKVNLENEINPQITLTNFTGIKYYNFYGIFRKVQIYYMPDPVNNNGTFDKVLYRY